VRRALAILVPVAAALAGCGAAAGHAPTQAVRATATATAAPCPALPPGGHALTLESSGLQRRALLHVPPAARPGRRLPLVIAFHGAGGNGPGFERESRLSRRADRSGFDVVYPDAFGSRPFWNMSGHVPGKPDDVAFTRDLITRVEGAACVDDRRVYATGVSNGGGMAARVGCELSSRIAAIAPVAGGYSLLDACRPQHRVSVLELHGTADKVVP
jgi:polyhydroxybutyrate depolymerase